MLELHGSLTALVTGLLLTVPNCPDGEDGEAGEEAGDGDGDGGGRAPPCFSEDFPRIPAATPDGDPDMALIVDTVQSGPPDGLDLGASIQVQGSHFGQPPCNDQDLPCLDSMVVRDAEGRFLVGMIQNNDVTPLPDPVFFDELGVTPQTWLTPFELTVVDDLPCPVTLGPCGGEKRRQRLELDAGTCETARLVDEAWGYFAARFFVSLNDLDRWEPPFACDEQPDLARLYIARQDCFNYEECPTYVSDACPPDGNSLEDQAYVSFADYGPPPTSIAYSYQCVIVSVDEHFGSYEYVLDCGDTG